MASRTMRIFFGVAHVAFGRTAALSVLPASRNFSTTIRIRSRRDPEAKKNYNFSTLKVENPAKGILQVELNRSDRLNALNNDAWYDIKECFDTISTDPECRVVILAASGKHFCAGIDLQDMGSVISLLSSDIDTSRKGLKLEQKIKDYQDSFTAIEKCRKPVIAAIHGGCIGAGIDMTSACDIRYCTEDAFFTIKEVDIGIAADVGTLQRFPKIVGNDSLVRELAFTARKFYAAEAKSIGFVSRLFVSREAMLAGAMDIASSIAAKSPVAVQGTKVHLNYSRDHSVEEGLDHMVYWQMTMLQSEDMVKAAMASADRSGKTIPEFADV